MNGYHFFACMPEGRRSKAPTRAFPDRWNRATIRKLAEAGKFADCVAVYTDGGHSFVRNGDVMREAVAGLLSEENSPCCSTAVGRKWLAARCVRVPEAIARKLHPELFRYLEQ